MHTELRKRLGLAGSRAETGTPEQAFSLFDAERSPIDRHSHARCVGAGNTSVHPSEG